MTPPAVGTASSTPPVRERGRPSRRRTLLVIAVLVAILTTTGVGIGVSLLSGDGEPAPLPARVDPLLPDLGIAPFTEFTGSRNIADNSEWIKFGVIIVNVGEGDFLLRARRASLLSDDWVVYQRIPERGGGFTERSTPATLIFGGDGHGHWHIREVETHLLETLDGRVLGEVVKQGYCFFDTTPYRTDLPGAPDEPVYKSSACGGRTDSSSSMGLSVGWGDEYPWFMLEQQIEVTGVPDGTYRLRAIADPFGWFDELDETNNEYWEEFELTRTSIGLPDVKVTRTSSTP